MPNHNAFVIIPPGEEDRFSKSPFDYPLYYLSVQVRWEDAQSLIYKRVHAVVIGEVSKVGKEDRYTTDRILSIKEITGVYTQEESPRSQNPLLRILKKISLDKIANYRGQKCLIKIPSCKKEG